MFWRRLLVIVMAVGLSLPGPVPAAAAAIPCNRAQFVSDISVPDGSTVIPGAVFTKIWRLKNTGSCTWTTGYSLVFDSGSQMGGATPLGLPKAVLPGQMTELAVTLAAPSEPGGYRGYWKLADAAGGRFGMGTAAEGAFWVDIFVQDSSTVVFDMAVFAPYAAWKSGGGPLPFPGTPGDPRGYAQRLDFVSTEEGAFSTAPSLISVPQTRTDGNIQGVYPPFTVQKGDRFQVGVGCEYGSACNVTYRLDYTNAAGTTRAFWTRRELNDKRVFQANVDLSPLAGQTVQFTLTLLATGSPAGDRALWVAPRIVRTIPPAIPPTPVGFPELTPTPTPFGAPPPAINPSACDKAAFVADINVPDGTIFAPGASFSKTWRLKNTGTCTWTTSYRAYFYSGERMEAPTVVNLPKQVRRGETVDLTINMTAPGEAGMHRGEWVLSNVEGILFGTGSPAINPFWIQINVAGGSAQGNGYDFAANTCAAQWRNGSTDLPCPGTDGDANGFVIPQEQPRLEDGSTSTLPGLLVAPRSRVNGYIQGVYPAFTVEPGDRFQAMIGCEFEAKCYVTFRLDTMNAAGTVRTLASWRERSEGRFFNIDQDLSALAGQSVRFILSLSATGSATGDRAIWGAPHIQRRTVTLPVTPTPTPSPTLPPPGEDWPAYTNLPYGFQFRYPAESQISGQTDTGARIDLPFMAGTNLREKYLQLQVQQNPAVCRTAISGGTPPTPPETVVINGISFLKETWLDGVMGQTYDWTAYSTQQGGNCVSLGFVLHSINPGAQETPPVLFDAAAEARVFGQIVNSFAWLPATATPTPNPPPLPDDWLTGEADHIRFKYPSGAQVVEQTNNHVRINLPFAAGTNLQEKYLDVRIFENATNCTNALNTQAQLTESVTINGVQFLKESGGEGAAGSQYDWVAYSSLRNGVCATFGFVLHSVNPGALPTPPPLYDRASESVVFDQIMSSFLWLIPPPVTPTFTPSPTASPTAGVTPPPPNTGWLNYSNVHYNFRFQYPQDASIISQMDNYARIDLSIAPGTNLKEKYLQVYVAENANPCRSPLALLSMPQTSENVVLNGQNFLKETGEEGAAGNLYQWTAYSISNGPACVSFNFALHSLNLGNFETPPPAFNAAAEKQVFEQIVGSFAWGAAPPVVTPTDTPVPGPLPDLAIGMMRIELGNPSCLMPGDGLGGRIQILNNGAADASGFVVRFGSSEQAVSGLAAGQSVTLFFPNYMYTYNPVTVSVDVNSQVAESSEDNNTRTEALAVPTAPLPCPVTPSPGVLSGPYGVVLTNSLTIYSDAGSANTPLGSFAVDTNNIMRTEQSKGAEGGAWVEVMRPGGGTGWVDFKYLTEYVSREAFCSDARVPALIAQIKQAVGASNGMQFAALVSPKHGVLVNLWSSAAPVMYTNFTAQSIFTDGTSHEWGTSEGAGGPSETGTFAQVVQPRLAAVLNSNYQLSCDDPANAGMYPRVWPHPNLHYYAVIDPGVNGVLDWRIWLLGFEYVEGQPYLISSVYYVWAP